MSSRQSLVTIRDLSVRYDNNVALEHVDLDIYADDFLGVIGPNGGGKSSLVKAIMGTIPHSGRIDYSESLLRGGKPHIGYMPQVSSFDKVFPISVVEVVMSGLQRERGLLRRYGKEERRRALETLELASVRELENRAIGELSGGQLQRVMLCRAIISEPRLLVLDEPTNFVDKQFESRLYDILSDLNHRMAIVMVSHDVKRVSNAVKSIVCINRTLHRHNSNTLTNSELEEYCGVKR